MGAENVQGEVQQKLDVYANERFKAALEARGEVCGMASEEEDFVSFDSEPPVTQVRGIDRPLDGSNIDVNVSVGTIFSIYRRVSKPGAGVTLKTSCSRATARSPPVTWSTAPRPCWSTPPALASTALPTTLHRLLLPLPREHPHSGGGQDLLHQRGELHQVPGRGEEVPQILPGAGRGDPTVPPPATSARWSPIFTATCSRAASTSIRPAPTRRTASCACSMSATPWRSWWSRPAARHQTALAASWTSSPPRCTSVPLFRGFHQDGGAGRGLYAGVLFP